MKRLFTISGAVILLAALVLTPSLGQQVQTPAQQELLNKYCLTCHNDKAKTGGLTLESMDVEHPFANAELWEKVIRKLRAGLMPPSGAPRPDRAALETFRASLEASIDQAASERPNPG